jgi:pimeloyl-ACP methyl ester carboxylesterase
MSHTHSMSRTIVFSHGNSFGAGTYRLLFEAWRAAGYTVLAVDRYGHDPAYPVASNWTALRNQLIDHTVAHASEPVHFVGHSLGGLLSLLAACRRPDLAASLVMLDSPVVTGWRAGFLRVSKSTGLIQHVSPGKASMRRRQHWPDHEAVYQHFKTKAVFAAWDDRVLRDYVATGFVERNGRVELGFDREVETRIYNTLPHHLGPLLRRHPPACPVGFVAGTDSLEMRQGGTATARALAGERYVRMAGSHLYPMEKPEQTARQVLALLAQTPSL